MWRVIERLLDFVFPPRSTEVIVRNTNQELLMEPRQIPTGMHETIALLPYRNQAAHAHIIEAKFHGNQKAQEMLGAILAQYVVDRVMRSDVPYALVPIPLSKERERTRGYNQTKEICRVAGAKLGIPVIDALERIRNTNPQTALSGAARRNNMRGAFITRPNLDPSYTYIVVDDVTTTGATFLSAIDAFKAAGAYHVLPIALAH